MSAQRRALPAARDDVELMEALAGGDLSSLGELYDRHVDGVRQFLIRTTGNRADADDLTHDTFLALRDAASRYDPALPCRAFVMGIAAKLTMRRRRSLAMKLTKLAEMARLVRRTEDRTPEALASTDQALERFEHALAGLPEEKRVVLIMADVEGFTGPEIAHALGIPVGTVSTRLHHARAKLYPLFRREVQ